MLGLVLFVWFACASEVPGTRAECIGKPERVHVTLTVEPSFPNSERVELQASADAWRELSGGQVTFTLTDDDDADGTIHRVISAMQIVKDRDADSSRDMGVPFYAAGWTSSGSVWLVLDRFKPEQLRYIFAHELGHRAGLEWPHCYEARSSCVHSPDPKALMSPFFNVQQGFNSSDLAFCRASCLCPN